jgi:hypothetical protein
VRRFNAAVRPPKLPRPGQQSRPTP